MRYFHQGTGSWKILTFRPKCPIFAHFSDVEGAEIVKKTTSVHLDTQELCFVLLFRSEELKTWGGYYWNLSLQLLYLGTSDNSQVGVVHLGGVGCLVKSALLEAFEWNTLTLLWIGTHSFNNSIGHKLVPKPCTLAVAGHKVTCMWGRVIIIGGCHIYSFIAVTENQKKGTLKCYKQKESFSFFICHLFPNSWKSGSMIGGNHSTWHLLV